MSKADKIKSGYWSVATQKHLKVFRTDATGLSQLGNLNITGKVGRLLGAIRGNEQITDLGKLEVMANNVGIPSMYELIMVILPLLEKASDGRIELIKDVTGELQGVAEYMFEGSQVLEVTGQVFETLNPSEVERVVIQTMDETKRLPYLQNELIELLTKQGYKEQNIQLSIALQDNFKLIQLLNKSKTQEPIISNEYVWGQNHDKIAKAITSLDIGQRESLKEIIGIIQRAQGYPLEHLSKEANQILQIAKKVGMINPLSISSKRGFDKEFGFSSDLLRHDIYDDDILDDVKLLLASIRFGENYTQFSTITDAKQFLSYLIDRGNIGPHSANATDYTMLEKRGIVRVVTKTKQGYYGPRTGPCLELLRKDVAEEALRIISNPDYKIKIESEITEYSSLMEVGSCKSPEEMRIAMLGQTTESSQDIEEHTVRMLRGELL